MPLVSVYKASSIKRELQDGLSKIRASRPLRLDVGQLTVLARHFKLKVSFRWCLHPVILYDTLSQTFSCTITCTK